MYEKTTSVGILRRHLQTEHLDSWLAECQSLDLVAKGKAAQGSMGASHGTGPRSQGHSRPQFSPERFINALVEFIVVNDLVCLYLFISLIKLIIVFSLSTL